MRILILTTGRHANIKKCLLLSIKSIFSSIFLSVINKCSHKDLEDRLVCTIWSWVQLSTTQWGGSLGRAAWSSQPADTSSTSTDSTLIYVKRHFIFPLIFFALWLYFSSVLHIDLMCCIKGIDLACSSWKGLERMKRGGGGGVSIMAADDVMHLKHIKPRFSHWSFHVTVFYRAQTYWRNYCQVFQIIHWSTQSCSSAVLNIEVCFDPTTSDGFYQSVKLCFSTLTSEKPQEADWQ